MKNTILILLILLVAPLAGKAQTPTPAPVPSPSPGTYEFEKKRADAAEARLRDYGQLDRFRDENSKLAPPAEKEDRVVFMGDSITAGFNLREWFPGRPYVNRGIGGQHTPQMLVRFRPDVIDLKPKIVVINGGTNDTGGAMPVAVIFGNIVSMVELAHANGIKVILASVHPVHDYGFRDGKPLIRTANNRAGRVLELNAMIKKYADSRGIAYIDYFAALVDEKGMFRREFSDDGIHPTKKGYEAMAPLAAKAIEETLKKKQKFD